MPLSGCPVPRHVILECWVLRFGTALARRGDGPAVVVRVLDLLLCVVVCRSSFVSCHLVRYTSALGSVVVVRLKSWCVPLSCCGRRSSTMSCGLGAL